MEAYTDKKVKNTVDVKAEHIINLKWKNTKKIARNGLTMEWDPTHEESNDDSGYKRNLKKINWKIKTRIHHS